MNDTKKQYRKLSAGQFRRLVGKLLGLKAGARELPELLPSATSAKVRRELDEGIYWAAFYELPFVQHVALALYLLSLNTLQNI